MRHHFHTNTAIPGSGDQCPARYSTAGPHSQRHDHAGYRGTGYQPGVKTRSGSFLVEHLGSFLGEHLRSFLGEEAWSFSGLRIRTWSSLLESLRSVLAEVSGIF